MGKKRKRLKQLEIDRAKAGDELDELRHDLGEIRARKQRKKKRKDETEKSSIERKMERQIEKLVKKEREADREIQKLRSRRSRWAEKIAELARQIRKREVVVSPGSPHWGGCEDIIVNEIVPVAKKAGVAETSGKRSETYGNPDSDHHTSQTTASARDFATDSNFSLRDKIMRKLGVKGGITDYGAYYIRRAGRTFRVQPIAGTHGTGPHLHMGLRLV